MNRFLGSGVYYDENRGEDIFKENINEVCINCRTRLDLHDVKSNACPIIHLMYKNIVIFDLDISRIQFAFFRYYYYKGLRKKKWL